MRERAHAKSDKGISGAAALAVKIDCRAAALFFSAGLVFVCT